MEKHLQKQIVDYLREQNYFVYSINPPNFKRMTYGTVQQLPDLCVVDLNLYIELKDAGYKAAHKDRQDKQEKVRQELINHGAQAYKVTSLEELKIIINTVRNNQG